MAAEYHRAMMEQAKLAEKKAWEAAEKEAAEEALSKAATRKVSKLFKLFVYW
jgi:hypothetical protein